MLVSYRTLALAFARFHFERPSIGHASYHDTRRSSNWPIARNEPQPWPRLLSYGPFGTFLIAFVIAIIVCVAYCCWAGWQNCNPANHRPTEYPSEAPEGYGQEPVFETPATGQIDQPVSAGYGHGTPVTATPVASAPPVEQSSGWTWSKATPAQQANRFNMCL